MSDSYKIYASKDYVDSKALPDGQGAHQQLITNTDGEAVWENRTHYEIIPDPFLSFEITIEGTTGDISDRSIIGISNSNYLVYYDDMQCIMQGTGMGTYEIYELNYVSGDAPVVSIVYIGNGITRVKTNNDQTGTHTLKAIDIDDIRLKQLDEKYIPDSVKIQSNWGSNDENALEYIHNRTHWLEYSPIFEWDGNTNDLATTEVTMYNTYTLYNIPEFDYNISIGTLDGAIVRSPSSLDHFVQNGQYTLSFDNIRNIGTSSYAIYAYDIPDPENDNEGRLPPTFVIIMPNDVGIEIDISYRTESDPYYTTFSSAGMWVCIRKNWEYYMSSIEAISKCHTLNEKFIPSSIARSADIPVAVSAFENDAGYLTEGFSGSWNDLSDKPFYKETSTTIDETTNKSIALATNENGVAECMGFECKYIVPNTSYALKVDGKVYTATSSEEYNGSFSDCPVTPIYSSIRNGCWAEFVDEHENPYCVIVYNYPPGYAPCTEFHNFPANSNITIELYELIASEIIHPLDPEFLPDTVGTVKSVNGEAPDENGNVVVEIPEGFSGSWNDLEDKPFKEINNFATIKIAKDGVSYDGYGFYYYESVDAPFMLEEGASYDVTLDNVKYTCVAERVSDVFVVLGDGYNYNTIAPEHTGNGEPFCIAHYYEVASSGYTTSVWQFGFDSAYFDSTLDHTITVTRTSIKTIDPKYLSEEVPVIQSAQVGQTIVVKSVDENGKPTEWECIDIPTELPSVTVDDAGKILRVQSDGTYALETLETEEWTFTLDDGTEVVKNVVVL